jgi:hypothetical protein
MANLLTTEVLNVFCHSDGSIDWGKLLTFNSGRQIPKARSSSRKGSAGAV